MAYSASNELLDEATEYFNNNFYEEAETILNQLILKSHKSPHIFHMLGTIYYDRGQFNKAIRSFKRAIEIDPSFTDASIGLSIILNDLGRYDEGSKVFREAQVMLDNQNKNEDDYVNEQISQKHDELGLLYFRHNRYKEALEQYFKSMTLSSRKPEITMNIVECYIKLDEKNDAIKALRELCSNYPEYLGARLKLGKIYYDSHQVPEAVEQWEYVLSKDPENASAKDYLRLASAVETTALDDDSVIELI